MKSSEKAFRGWGKTGQDSCGGKPVSLRSGRWGANVRWIPQGGNVEVAGRMIGGMVYVGDPGDPNQLLPSDEFRPCINPKLGITQWEEDKIGEKMDYWPGYSTINPSSRAAFLNWLSSGRCDESYDLGYLYLYFYGLERRFFLDDSQEEEKQQIIDEVERLNRLYPDKKRLHSYLSKFLDVARLLLNDAPKLEPILERMPARMPLSLKLAIAAQLEDRRPLSWEWLLSWFINHPNAKLRTSATRCPEEFQKMFSIHFQEKFPDGYTTRVPSQKLEYEYEAVSSDFKREVEIRRNGKKIVDISSLDKLLTVAQGIADRSMEDITKFARYVFKPSSERESIEAHALLPLQLRAMTANKELEELRAWAHDQVKHGGLVPVEDVVGRLGNTKTDKISKGDLTGAADALARVSFGLAPDPRFALRRPKEKEPVVIFELGEEVEALEDVSDAYRSELMLAALKMFIANADGDVSEVEMESLRKQAESGNLNELERRRFDANIRWMMAVPPDISMLRSRVRNLDPTKHVHIRAAIVGMAQIDGVVDKDEVKAVEKIYKAMGFDSNLAYSDLHAGIAADGPVSVRPEEVGLPGEHIPSEEPERVAVAVGGIALDQNLVNRIRGDTRSRELLSSIFGQGDDAEDKEEEAVTSIHSPLEGLTPVVAEMVIRIIERPNWEESDLMAMSAEIGQPLDGVLESINEWAHEKHEDALLEQVEEATIFELNHTVTRKVMNDLN